jgi:hypothetical protein
MLDSLGSTLSRTTVNSFFTRHNKKPLEDELSMSEAIQCLETELDVLRRKRDACQTILTMAVSTGLAFRLRLSWLVQRVRKGWRWDS